MILLYKLPRTTRSSLTATFLIFLLIASLGPLGLPKPALGIQNHPFIAGWGGLGSGNGQLNYPTAMTFDSTGNLYVADSDNNRIQKFSAAGAYLDKFGTYGTGPGQLHFPAGIAFDTAGNIYVVDRNNHRVQKFDSGGNYQSQFGIGGAGNGQFDYPDGIAIDSANNIYVADTYNNRIQKFNSSGVYVTKWTGLSQPEGLAVDSADNIYVADTFGHKIKKFNSEGALQAQWGSGSASSADGSFKYPRGVAVDPSSGNVFVADTLNDRVQKFTSTGGFLAKWGSLGAGDGQFDFPEGVAVDTSGNVYVADSDNHRIQKFGPAAAGPPTTALTTDPAAPNGDNGWFKTSPTITLTANGPGATYYRWGTSGGWTAYSTAFSAPQGQKTLYYYSQDPDGIEPTKQQVFKVDSVKPSVLLSAPKISTKASKTTTFKVKWSGVDATPQSGVASYQVQRKIGRRGTWRIWKSWIVATASYHKGEPGKTYYFRARAEDKAGNLSSWSTVKRTIVPYDNNSLISQRSGFGGLFKKVSSGFYLGTTRYSTKRGHKITYRFKGKSVALIGPRAKNRSQANIYINGKLVKTIDAYSSKLRHRKVLYSLTWKKVGTRTITVENLGTPGRRRLDVDGLAVER